MLLELEISVLIFEKFWKIKCHQNPSSGSRGPCERTDRHERIDMTWRS